MSDSEKKLFERTYNNIKAPEALKSETYQKVLTGTVLTSRSRKRMLTQLVGGGAVGVMLCAAVLLFVLLRPTGPVYVTPMEEGIYYEDVELKNGEIHFVKSRVAISVTPNAGMITIGEEETSGEIQGDIVREEIQTEGGGSFTFEETDEISLPEIAESNWSYIDKQHIYVTVLQTKDTIYQAVFEKDGAVYKLVGTGVTQKEFIDILYEKIK